MRKQVAPWMLSVPVFFLASAFSPVTALAEGGRIRISTELEYFLTHEDLEVKATGDQIESDRSSFRQLYNLEIQKELYPYLDFRAGGLLRLLDLTSTAEGTDPDQTGTTDFDESLGRVFAELNLNNPLYTASAAYHWSELEEDQSVDSPVVTSDSRTELFREEWDGRFRWRPEGLPLVDLEFNRFRLYGYDDSGDKDRLDDRLKLETRYDYEGLSSDYTYTRLDSEQRIVDYGSLTQIHDGGMRYSDSFFGDRLSMTGGFRLRYSTLEPTGTGEEDLSVDTPAEPFSVVEVSDPAETYEADFKELDDPDAGKLGVDDQAQEGDVSFGLNFTFPTEVDTIYIVPSSDAGYISPLVWTVYTSDDGDGVDPVTWDERAEFGPIQTYYSVADDRFEIRFPFRVNARRIKVLTRSQYDDRVPAGGISVERVQAFITIPVTPGLKIKNFVQNYNLGLRWAITDRTTTAYEGFYRRQEDHPLGRQRTTLTNGIRLQHVFSPVFFGSARVLRTDSTASDQGDVVSHLYSASLRANYLDTLNQTLVYSGRHDKEELGSGTTDSLILRTNADLYRDWSMYLDLGYTWRKPIEGVKGTIALLRVGTDVTPNEKLHFTVDYLASWKTQKGDRTRLDQNAGFQAFWVPFRTVSLFGRVNLRRRESTNEGLLVTQNYSFNWAPFPDGALNFSLAYNQTLEVRDVESRILSPQVEWQITRNSLLTVRFNLGTIESERDKRDVWNLRTELKIFY